MRCTSQLTEIHTPTTIITISAGTTNSWMMNRAEGGSTGGNMIVTGRAAGASRGLRRIRLVGAELGWFVGSWGVGHASSGRVLSPSVSRTAGAVVNRTPRHHSPYTGGWGNAPDSSFLPSVWERKTVPLRGPILTEPSVDFIHACGNRLAV